MGLALARLRAVGVLMAVLLGLGVASTPALAASEPAPPDPTHGLVVAPPGAASLGYAAPIAIVSAGDGLDFLNTDVSLHNVVSVARDDLGKPIFKSALSAGPGSTPVVGVESLTPGDYDFYCSLHPGAMTGTLTVR
jgi:plastocyanin